MPVCLTPKAVILSTRLLCPPVTRSRMWPQEQADTKKRTGPSSVTLVSLVKFQTSGWKWRLRCMAQSSLTVEKGLGQEP